MSAPRGKGIYARDPDFYPDANPGAYALAMGCQFIALLDPASSDDDIRRSQDLGLQVFLWNGPGSWVPNNWQRTLYTHAERVAQLDLDGFIADVEHQNQWRGHEQEVYELAGTLGSAAQTYRSVGFTSFPSWKWMPDVAEIAGPKLWGSPQLYGILQPAPALELLDRADRWRKAFPEIAPSLAAWRRTPEEQADYLEVFRRERAAIFWQSPTTSGRIKPWPGTEGFRVLSDWNVNLPRGILERPTSVASVVAERILHPMRLRRV